MRKPEELFACILSAAQEDERIHAVVMNGSRANPNAPRDLFQDYDIVFLVTDAAPFAQDSSYIRRFGEPLLVQMPETMRDPMGDGRFTYLTLFRDGCRIDLQIVPADRWQEILGTDSETIVLLDKNGILPAFPPASDRDYWVRRPSLLEFSSCCNNFWWCMQNVAKGIWRGELPYAMEMYNADIRAELNDIVSWYIGIQENFAVSVGKMGKYFRRFLPASLYERYLQTYSDAQPARLWDAVFTACGLFGELAPQVAAYFSFPYEKQEEINMMAYLRMVRSLPSGASEFPETLS